MSQLVVSNEGLAYMMGVLLKGNPTAGLPTVWRLYTNDRTPARSNVVAQYTEAGWAGYDPVAFTAADWLRDGLFGLDEVWRFTAFTAPFFNTSPDPVTAVGYFVTPPGGAVLLWAQRFDLAWEIDPGDGRSLVPALLGRSLFPE